MTGHPHGVGGVSHDVTTARVRVVLAHARAAVRRSLRLLLEHEGELRPVGDADGLDAAMRAVRRLRADVLVIDSHVLGKPGSVALRRLRMSSPGTQIVVLTMDASPKRAREALDAGALGYVLTERSDLDLGAAIRSAHGGRVFVSAPIATRLRSGDEGPRAAESVRRAAER